MKENELKEISGLIGETVLIPIKAGSKAPAFKGWNKLTASSRHDEELQKKLRSHGNVGVLLGEASDGLCTIDIDHDAEVERFLQCNPRFRETLQTRGNRGANLWIRIIGNRPRLKTLQRNGEPWGEWRGDGAQTVIQGIHPTGKPYVYVKKAPPIEISFGEIQWPVGVAFVGQKHQSVLFGEVEGEPLASGVSSSSESSVILCDSADSERSMPSMLLYDTLHRSSLAVEAFKSRNRFAEKYPRLETCYADWIERNHNPVQGQRNTNLIQIVTFLFHCLSPEMVLIFAEQFYDRNQVIWKDSRDQHMKEAKSHLNKLLDQYEGSLPAPEADLYKELSPGAKTAFRIARDLASRKMKETGEASFFLSCQNLGDRTKLDSTQANRILKSLLGAGVIEIKEKGKPWSTGKKGVATTYRWLYSVAERTEDTPPPP